MIGAALFAIFSKDYGSNDLEHVYRLDQNEKYAAVQRRVYQQKRTRNQPYPPRRNTNAPGTFLDIQVTYLREVRRNDQSRPHPADDFQSSCSVIKSPVFDAGGGRKRVNDVLLFSHNMFYSCAE